MFYICNFLKKTPCLTILFSILIFGLQVSYSIAMNDKVEIQKEISSYKIFKYKNKFYSTLEDELLIENDEVVINSNMIINENIKKIEERIVLKLDNKPFFYKTLANYNIVIYGGKVFAAPQGLEIDWGKDSFENIKGIIIKTNLTEIEDTILKNPFSWKPLLEDTFLKYNIVNFKNRFYGIPFGHNVDFYKGDLSNDKRLIINDNTITIKAKILKLKIITFLNKFI